MEICNKIYYLPVERMGTETCIISYYLLVGYPKVETYIESVLQLNFLYSGRMPRARNECYKVLSASKISLVNNVY